MVHEKSFYIGMVFILVLIGVLLAALCCGCTHTHIVAQSDGSWEFTNSAFLADATNGHFTQEPAKGGGRFVDAEFSQRAYKEGQSATNQTLRSVTNSIAWLGAVASGAGGNILGTLAGATVGYLTRDREE